MKKFPEFQLDPRILQGLTELKFTKTTSVQEKAIPLILDGKDTMIRSRTGSGKTAAYAVPICQQILKAKSVARERKTRAIVLVPTKELAQQVTGHFNQISYFCENEILTVNASSSNPEQIVRPMLQQNPEIIVGTPAKVLYYCSQGIHLDCVDYFVIDEADLMLSFGCDSDLSKIIEKLPQLRQSILVSATLTKEVDALSSNLLRSPVHVNIEATELEKKQLTQYCVMCTSLAEKFLLLFFILKLKLIRGKAIIFVNDIDKCYRVKLLLSQFGIMSCVLNSELPLNSRIHIVEEFNKGVYDYIIASDEQESLEKSEFKKDKEYGVSRGIDFQNASTVINFDFPSTEKAYTHRIGRTARAGHTGLAISFVYHKGTIIKEKGAKEEEKVFIKVQEEQKGCVFYSFLVHGVEIEPFVFDMEAVSAFQYRMDDAMRAVTKSVVRDARVKEITRELLNSEKLKSHFEHNPNDLNALRHDKSLHPTRTLEHLKHIPDYLMPNKGMEPIDPDEFIPFQKKRSKKDSWKNKKRLKKDPLKKF